MISRPLSALACLMFLGGLHAGDVVKNRREPTFAEFKPAADVWYMQAAASSAYAKATAHEPLFAEQALWGQDVQVTRYAKQVWPKTRVLVWAKPGEGAKDGWLAKYWLEDGKPASKPFDTTCDLVLPPQGYTVNLTDGRKYPPAAFRHLTIEAGALVVGHFSAQGNVWIKQGGKVICLDSAVGGGHTFWRNDNLHGMCLVGHFHFRKEAAGSVEFIGRFYSEDNWQFHSGLFIVAPDSEIGMGNRTAPQIDKDATVALMSGATLARRTACDWDIDLRIEGKLLAGLPERPLTRDARLGLSWKSKGILWGTKGGGGGREPGPDDLGLIVQETGSITVTSADPAKSHLLINCNKRDPDWVQINIISNGKSLTGEALVARLNELPRRMDMLIKGNVTWPGILLDDVRAGGIHVKATPDLSISGKGPNFGRNNDGKPADLFVLW